MAKAVKKQTRPPPRLNDATLLTAMETAGRTLDEKELSDAMKDSGLGTPATRASIIETLLARGYVVRDGKALQATERGVGLIAVVDPEVKSAAMTGEWEAKFFTFADGLRDRRNDNAMERLFATLRAGETDARQTDREDRADVRNMVAVRVPELQAQRSRDTRARR